MKSGGGGGGGLPKNAAQSLQSHEMLESVQSRCWAYARRREGWWSPGLTDMLFYGEGEGGERGERREEEGEEEEEEEEEEEKDKEYSNSSVVVGDVVGIRTPRPDILGQKKSVEKLADDNRIKTYSPSEAIRLTRLGRHD